VPPFSSIWRRLGRGLRRAGIVAIVVLATIVAVRAWDARRPPGLKPWHRFAPPSELTARDLTDAFTLDDYLKREDRIFREVEAEIEQTLAPEDRFAANRYHSDGLASPRRFSRDWNRTFELVPDTIRGGALLLHGLTDSPYSMRSVAELLRDRGYYALALRVPGHGTVPGALTRAVWEDWIAAVRMAARHVARRAGPGRPFVLVGYSNGGALSVKYALDVADGAALPRPDAVVLMSPMIGVTPAAALAKFLGKLAVFPYFEKTRWLDIVPEYNPFKYNSFPVNAGVQTSRLTAALQEQLARAGANGRLRAMPRILTFQSVCDATVVTAAVVHKLYDALPPNGSELVLFDLNRGTPASAFLEPAASRFLAELTAAAPRSYGLTIVANRAPDSREVVARTYPAGNAPASEKALEASWPLQVYSLSHVAVPFPMRDPLFGGEPEGEASAIHLGVLAPRGERGVLTVSPDQFLRITYNPFFPYLAERVASWTAIP
jgi:alpha-beta hydrolase superfamily lysophospholipase